MTAIFITIEHVVLFNVLLPVLGGVLFESYML